jgi:tetratricopeptide (TPR) repeat protein
MSPEDLCTLGEVASGFRVDRASLAGLTTAEWLVRWRELRRRHPDFGATSPEEAQARHRREAERLDAEGRWAATIPHLDALIKAQPEEAPLLALRGRARAELGRLKEADADYARAIELGTDPWCWWAHALLRAHLGDSAGFHETCERLLTRFGDTGDLPTIDVVVQACNLAPDAVADRARPVRLAETVVAGAPRNRDDLNTLGVALYRAGRYEEAIGRLNEARALTGDPQGTVWDWLFLAMAHGRLGHTAEAREWLGRAERWIDREASGGPANPVAGTRLSWNQRLGLQLFRREAEAMIAGQGTPPLER